MVFCHKCGTRLGEGVRFCPTCGAASMEGSGEEGKTSSSSSSNPRGSPSRSPPAANGAAASFANGAPEFTGVIDDLKRAYKSKILPLEQLFKFDEFHSPSLTDTDFDAKPMVLLIGQYSTGKTTFIRYMLERDFPGSHIGPEPTTDRFMAVMHGKDERTIPGNALAADASKPFTALQKYGMAFLNKFELSQCQSPILEKISFIDTPGVLSGEKQRIGRSYDFPTVISWFAERADRILLLFDAHKLDISDEFKSAIECLKGHDDKIRVVLNKADIPISQLMRVYGALMWSLGKVIRTPEVLRVFIGSFWDGPINNAEIVNLLRSEQADLLADLRALPRNSTVRKINELVKRARMAKVHAHLLNHLRGKFGVFGKKKDQEKMLQDKNLAEHFRTVQQIANLPQGDFPNMRRFQEQVSKYEIWKFPKLDKKLLERMDEVLSKDIPALMRLLPQEDAAKFKEYKQEMEVNPFAPDPDREEVQSGWAISTAVKRRYDNEFYSLELGPDNKASGSACKKIFLRSGLEQGKLRVIWDLADIDKDGALDHSEFAVAMYLIEQVQSGGDLPSELPADVVPPTKR